MCSYPDMFYVFSTFWVISTNMSHAVPINYKKLEFSGILLIHFPKFPNMFVISHANSAAVLYFRSKVTL